MRVYTNEILYHPQKEVHLFSPRLSGVSKTLCNKAPTSTPDVALTRSTPVGISISAVMFRQVSRLLCHWMANPAVKSLGCVEQKLVLRYQ